MCLLRLLLACEIMLRKMCKCQLLFFSVVFVANIIVVSSFNVDTVNYVQHVGQRKSMFGFSIATHKTRGTNWVLVGAPRAQSNLTSIRRGGAVYRCSTVGDDICQELPFDTKGDNVDTHQRPIDNKSEQWLGATVYSAGEEGLVVACAPRYVWFTSKRDRIDPVGTCFVSRGDFGEFAEYSPCRTSMWGYHRQGYCQAGFSAGISKDNKNLFIGAPGSWYWHGRMYSIDTNARFAFTPGIFGGDFGSGQVIRQSLEDRPAVVSTRGGPEKDDDSYLGYSLTVGDFTGAGTQGIAVGMPRAATLKGKVVIFTWNLTNYQNITGEQLGGYFGYATATSDVDGDGLDDLIVGAPLFTEPNNEEKYEVGRVYVIYQGGNTQGRFRRLHTLDGTNSKSRFGLSLASLGDVNLDGYGDFAVGAPYDGPRERGAVYIYHGSEDGVRKKYSQVIFAEDIDKFSNGPRVETFGWSLSGGLDLDDNDYPDMSVGAYLSDTAFFFRSRPVVKVDANVRYLTPNKQIILDEKNCTLRNGQRVPCTSFSVCMKYKGVGVPVAQVFDIRYVLDSKKTKGQRMFFMDSENKYVLNENWNLRKDDASICRTKAIYLTNEIRDKLTSLEIEVHYSMSKYSSQEQSYRRDPRSQLLPILDLNMPTVRKDAISVHKNCGPDNICIPNLKLLVKPSVQKYLLGSNKKLELDVIVENDGEDSFESTYELQLPPGIDFIRVVEYEKNEVRILCSPSPNNTIRCDIGNPLPAHKIARFTVQLRPYHKEGMSPSYDFNMIVNSTNPEINRTADDNKAFLSVHIWVDSKLSLEGTSRPADVHYNYSSYTSEAIVDERDIGPQVIHVYGIRNNGPSSINEAEIFILWPFTTLAGDDLLYLLEQPQTLGNVRCEPASANYKHYGVDFRKKSIWETLGMVKGDGAVVASAATGAVDIEEGKATYAETAGAKKTVIAEKKNESIYETGDASIIHQHRQQESGKADEGSGGGQTVRVLEDTGRGSKTIITEIRHKTTSVNGGPPVNTTYTRQEVFYGRPGDGKLNWTSSQQGGRHETRVQQTYGEGGTGASSGGSISYGGSSSQGGSYSGETSYSGGETSHRVTGSSLGGGGGAISHEVHGGGASYGETSHGSAGSSYGRGGTISHEVHGGGATYGETSHGAAGSSYGRGGTISHEVHSGGASYGETSHGSAGSSYGRGGTSSHEAHGGGSSYEESSYGKSSFGRGGTSTSHATYGGGSLYDTGSSHETHANGGEITGGHVVTQTRKRPNIVYTSSGSQHGQDFYHQSQSGSSAEGTENGHTTLSVSGTMPEGRYVAPHVNEDGSISGSVTYVESPYPGYKPPPAKPELLHGDNGNGYGSRYDKNYRNSLTSEERYGKDEGRLGIEENSYGQSGSVSREREYELGHGDVELQRRLHAQGNREQGHQEGYGAQEGSSGGGYREQHRSGSRMFVSGSGRDRSSYGKYNQSSQEDFRNYGIGAAALNPGGFKTTGVALSPVGNVDRQIDQDARTTFDSNSGISAYGSDTGIIVEEPFNSGETFRAATRGGNSRTFSSGGGASYAHGYEKHSETSYSSGGSYSSPGFEIHREIPGDNVPTSKPDLSNPVHRGKRQVEDQADIDLDSVMSCKATRCIPIRCTAGPLLKDQEAFIALRSRVNVQTLRNISITQSITFSSMMLARISQLPYIGKPLDRQIHSHEIFTTVSAPEPEIKPDIVPLWVVVLSAVAGTIILLLLVFLLYKCGFFKRNRPSDAPERQPLNRNGHFQHGDEAL